MRVSQHRPPDTIILYLATPKKLPLLLGNPKRLDQESCRRFILPAKWQRLKTLKSPDYLCFLFRWSHLRKLRCHFSLHAPGEVKRPRNHHDCGKDVLGRRAPVIRDVITLRARMLWS